MPRCTVLLAALIALTGLCGAFARSAAAQAGTDGTGDRVVALKVGEAERRAILVNPAPAGERRAAVIVLHGGAGSAAQMRASSGFDTVARANGFIAVYAEGTEFGEGRHAWNTGHLLRRQVRDAEDIAYFDALIDRLVAEHGADPARIFMTGGSNGGMMTFVYAAARAERLAAAAPVVASMFSFDSMPKVPLPILIVNGAKDDEVPIDGGMSRNAIVRAAQATPFKPLREVVGFWVKANKSRPEPAVRVDGTVTTSTYAAAEGGAVTEFVVDSAGGHGWPGTSARRGDNTPIMAFRGAERVWAFFADKTRAPRAAGSPAAKAAIAAEIIEFPDLVDAARRAAAPAEPARPRLFPRRGEKEPAPAGRKVPLRIHMPAGAGPFPVVVVSHGAGGDWDTHFGQAQDLAAHGYAVICVEHVGSNRARLKGQGLRLMKAVEAMTRDAEEVLARPRDISFAIDRAEEWNGSHPKLRGRLDVARVGVMGHSFGAYTTMAVCGMRPALDWLVPTVAPGKGLGPDLRDPRVRCGVALSPQSPGEPFFLAESYAGLQVPLLGITGSRDDQQAGRTAIQRKEAFALWPNGKHLFVWLANAGHNDFTSSSGATGGSLPSANREDVQPVVRAATRAFLDLNLRLDPDAAERLTAEALKPHLRGEVDAVDVLTR